MRTTLFLVFILFNSIYLSKSFAHGSLCQHVFKENKNKSDHSVIDPLLSGALNNLKYIEEYQLFKRTKRGRTQEEKHLREDLEGVSKVLTDIRQNGLSFQKDTIQEWDNFLKHWAPMLEEFNSLPENKKKQLKPYVELVVSLSTKHLVAFLEAPNHRRWNITRLSQILKSSSSLKEQDLSLSLFLVQREVGKFYSLWDFIQCKY